VPNSRPRLRRQKARRRAVVGTSLLAVVAVGTYLLVRSLAPVIVPVLTGSGCQAAAAHQSVLLDTQQASIAATIAGVAHEQSMPRAAVTIAYATAMQESKLHDLTYGDMDSVGVFQQRPSQGWGPRAKLENPVYATTKFFRALKAVRGYQTMRGYYEMPRETAATIDPDGWLHMGDIGSMDARGFGSGPRTTYRPIAWLPLDAVMGASAAVILVVALLLGR